MLDPMLHPSYKERFNERVRFRLVCILIASAVVAFAYWWAGPPPPGF
jgi:hypothetical protein